MKRTTWGILAGGAVAATFLTSATADADTSTDVTWTPTYDIDNAILVQAANSTAFAWETPSTFTHGATTLTGTDYVTTSSGGYDNEFVTDSGAIYDQDQLGLGFTNLYYDPNPGGTGDTVVDMLKTPLGTFDISPFASLFTPTDYSDAVPASGTTALENSGLYSALDLGLPSGTTGADGTWSPVYGTTEAMQASFGTGVGAVVFESPDSTLTFTPTDGGSAITLNGTDYVTASSGGYENEFVTDDGAIYLQDQLGLGFTNLLYYPGSGDSVVDMLKTPFGTFDISPFGYFVPPIGVDTLVAASPLTDLTDSGLYSALDLGLTAP